MGYLKVALRYGEYRQEFHSRRIYIYKHICCVLTNGINRAQKNEVTR